MCQHHASSSPPPRMRTLAVNDDRHRRVHAACNSGFLPVLPGWTWKVWHTYQCAPQLLPCMASTLLLAGHFLPVLGTIEARNKLGPVFSAWFAFPCSAPLVLLVYSSATLLNLRKHK